MKESTSHHSFASCWFFAAIQSDLRLPGYYASMTVPCLEHFSCQRRNASNVKVLEISHSRKQEYTCRFSFVLFDQIYDDVFSRLYGALWVCLSLFHALPLLLLPIELFGDLSCKSTWIKTIENWSCKAPYGEALFGHKEDGERFLCYIFPSFSDFPNHRFRMSVPNYYGPDPQLSWQNQHQNI